MSGTCRHGVWEAACATCKPIGVSKDQLWHFRWRHKAETHQVSSKAQFQRLCKARGLVQVTHDDLVTRGEPSRPTKKTVPREVLEKVVREVRPTFQRMLKGDT